MRRHSPIILNELEVRNDEIEGCYLRAIWLAGRSVSVRCSVHHVSVRFLICTTRRSLIGDSVTAPKEVCCGSVSNDVLTATSWRTNGFLPVKGYLVKENACQPCRSEGKDKWPQKALWIDNFYRRCITLMNEYLLISNATYGSWICCCKNASRRNKEYTSDLKF
jgi:hypothetical protein